MNYKDSKDKVAYSFRSANKFIVVPNSLGVFENLTSANCSDAESMCSEVPEIEPGEAGEEDGEVGEVVNMVNTDAVYFGKVIRMTASRITIEDCKDEEALYTCPLDVIASGHVVDRDDKVFYKKNPNGDVSYIEKSPLVYDTSDGLVSGKEFHLEENEEVEFKSMETTKLPGNYVPDAQKKNNSLFVQHLEKYVTGFLNSSRGGTLYFGIRDDATVVGTVAEADRRKQQDQIRTAIDYAVSKCISPSVEPDFIKVTFINIYDEMFDGFLLSKTKMVVKIKVESSGKKLLYATRDDTRYIRHSGSNIKMTNEMINARFSA